MKSFLLGAWCAGAAYASGHGNRGHTGARTSGPRIALVADELTRAALHAQARVVDLVPHGLSNVLLRQRPDFLLVESAWSGWCNTWKYQVAQYPDHRERNNAALVRLVSAARDLGIPTVFWNKEDGVHFDRFIETARHFDYVFTVDSNCLPRYEAKVPAGTRLGTLMFAVQPKFHHFSGFNFVKRVANFVGSYSHHVHERRRQWQDLLFREAASTLGLTIFDRNSKRSAHHYRYPALPGTEVHKAVPYQATGRIYKDHLVSLNVNTVEDSPTMFSRRLVEILACGGIAVTNPTLAVSSLFAEYCHVITSAEDARDLFIRLLRTGPSPDDLERARAGAEQIANAHTWGHRLGDIAKAIGLG